MLRPCLILRSLLLSEYLEVASRAESMGVLAVDIHVEAKVGFCNRGILWSSSLGKALK